MDDSEAQAVLEEYTGPRYEIESGLTTVVDLYLCHV